MSASRWRLRRDVVDETLGQPVEDRRRLGGRVGEGGEGVVVEAESGHELLRGDEVPGDPVGLGDDLEVRHQAGVENEQVELLASGGRQPGVDGGGELGGVEVGRGRWWRRRP